MLASLQRHRGFRTTSCSAFCSSLNKQYPASSTSRSANLHGLRQLVPRASPKWWKWSVLALAQKDSGFHQNRLKAVHLKDRKDALAVAIREATTDEELHAAAVLRAQSFYAYPPERQLAGQLHQIMMTEEEYKALKLARLEHQLGTNNQSRGACLIATACAAEMPLVPLSLVLAEEAAVVGTCDVHAVRALPGEALIGNCQNAAYLANVCVANGARRRGVGVHLLKAARQLARSWGVEQLYVHTMAVNEAALQFYFTMGFTVEKEESSNFAHYRGHCLDGINGRGRTVLLRDSHLSTLEHSLP